VSHHFADLYAIEKTSPRAWRPSNLGGSPRFLGRKDDVARFRASLPGHPNEDF
jgi:hypothetical protein